MRFGRSADSTTNHSMTMGASSVLMNLHTKRRRWLPPVVEFFWVGLAVPLPAFTMTVVEPVPTANQIMDGSALAFSLRLDRPDRSRPGGPHAGDARWVLVSAGAAQR